LYSPEVCSFESTQARVEGELAEALVVRGVGRIERKGMHWSGWLVGALMVLQAGWMAFDGTRALVVGDFVTPRSGPHAGQLGPWSRLARAAGIEPRSTLMKMVFVVYGVVALGVSAVFLASGGRAWMAMLLAAVGGLWFAPIGTVIDVVVVLLLCLGPLRPGS
jgi:hypothetical protein